MDRNKYVVQCRKVMGVSLSARRAWIEIFDVSLNYKEVLSLSARRAWIEISLVGFCCLFGLVALRKESVDRN